MPTPISRSTSAPGPAPIRAHVDVVVDLETLLALADNEGTLHGDGPGGPVTIAGDVVRQLIADDPTATIRRLVSDPLTGHLLDRGRSTYLVPDRLRDFIASRDMTCRFPGCGRRAGLAQIDHAVAWDDGGPTDRSNLGALCVRHHLLKTHSGWRITQSGEDGSCRWRSPAGFDYEHPPRRVVPASTPPPLRSTR